MLVKQLRDFCEMGGFGIINEKVCTRINRKLAPIVISFDEEFRKKEILWENSFVSGTIALGDTQHSHPQRVTHAIHATSSILNLRGGGFWVRSV